MTRDDLKAIANKHVPASHRPGSPWPVAKLEAAAAEIAAYFATPAGQAEIAAGPQWHRHRTPAELGRLLASELPWMVG